MFSWFSLAFCEIPICSAVWKWQCLYATIEREEFWAQNYTSLSWRWLYHLLYQSGRRTGIWLKWLVSVCLPGNFRLFYRKPNRVDLPQYQPSRSDHLSCKHWMFIQLLHVPGGPCTPKLSWGGFRIPQESAALWLAMSRVHKYDADVSWLFFTLLRHWFIKNIKYL